MISGKEVAKVLQSVISRLMMKALIVILALLLMKIGKLIKKLLPEEHSNVQQAEWKFQI